MARRKQSAADKALSAVVDAVGKLAGDPEIAVSNAGIIPSGNPVIDRVIGRGGLPTGRIVTFMGARGGGKTTAALLACAACQAADGLAIYLDAEGKVERDRAAVLGIDVNKWAYRRPETIEGSIAAFDKAITAIGNVTPGRPVLCVLDSVNATPAQMELKAGRREASEYHGERPGAQARAYSAAFRRFTKHLGDSSACILLIGQERETISKDGKPTRARRRGKKIGVGNAIEFYSTVIVEFREAGEVTSPDDEVTGVVVEVEAVKNQVAAPFAVGEYVLRFTDGLDLLKAVVDEGTRAGVIGRSGTAWISFPANEDDAPKWNGLRKLRHAVRKNPDLLQEMIKALRGAT